MRLQTLTRSLGAVIKLGICGASILAIGWAILMLDGSEVQEASADILSVSPAPLTNTARFEKSLKALGHGEPRVYDYNGNEVGFSTRYVRHKKPRRLLEQYQREFVRQGLNEQTYQNQPGSELDRSDPKYLEKSADAASERVEAMMSGQIVPLEVHDGYAAMGAGLITGKPSTRAQARQRLKAPKTDDFDELFEGYRMIEIFREPSSGATAVTAAWSRGDFEMKNHRPDRHADQRGVNPSLAIPSCMGCKRSVRFGGKANAKPDAVNIFETSQKPSRVVDFYDETMANRGWRRTETNQMLDRVLGGAGDVSSGTIFRQYRRANSEVSMRIRYAPSLDKTTITAYQSK